MAMEEMRLQAELLGKIIYFNLSNIFIDREILSTLCGEYEIPYTNGGRVSGTDAFRSATSSVSDRVAVEVEGQQLICRVFFRENRRSATQLSKELVLEIPGHDSNHYIKLANLCFNQENQTVRNDNIVDAPCVDVQAYCALATERFERYKRCASRKKIETICTNYLHQIQATKLGSTAHIYFVPWTRAKEVERFVGFVRALRRNNEDGAAFEIYSFPLLKNDEMQRLISAAFCECLLKELQDCTNRVRYLIDSDSRSPVIMERWKRKIEYLERKRKEYEELLHTKMGSLDSAFDQLNALSKELQDRVELNREKRTA